MWKHKLDKKEKIIEKNVLYEGRVSKSMSLKKWLGIAFFSGMVFSANSIFASTSVPASITIEDSLVAASITPSSLDFRPDIGSFDSANMTIENTGDVAFYPSIEYTAFTDTGEVEVRGTDIQETDKLIFKIANNEVDTEVPGVYPKGRLAVSQGEAYRIPLSVGAGQNIPETESKNLSFQVTVTLDKVMQVVENFKAVPNGTSAELTWDPFMVNGITSEKYRIYAFKLNKDTGNYQRVGVPRVANTTSLTWTGLQTGEEYKFEIIPAHSNVYQFKALSSATTSFAVPDGGGQSGTGFEVVADQVQNVQVVMDGTTMNLTWDAFNDSTQYRVLIAKKTIGATNYGSALPYSTTGTSYTRSLVKGNDYKITVVPYVGGTPATDKTSEPVYITVQ
ncbi:fibronectin type III domain-containing protein [Cytobacillus pseudoceanisediminis]